VTSQSFLTFSAAAIVLAVTERTGEAAFRSPDPFSLFLPLPHSYFLRRISPLTARTLI